jgi:replicative DNA helicase
MEKRGSGEQPKLSDLRESGSIEQDADLVGLLYRESKNKDGEDDTSQFEDTISVKLFIAKQRNGPIGEVGLTFLKSFTRFESAAKVSPEDERSEA